MKNKKWKRIVFAAALLAVLAISGISALFTDGDTMANIFTVGKVDIKLLEPNWTPSYVDVDGVKKMPNITPRQEFAKDPQIANVGANDAYVFMEVVVPYANITTVDDNGGNKKTAETELFSYVLNPDSDWVQIGDAEKDTVLKTITRRYAYGTADEMTVLQKETTTSTLFDYIRFANVVEDQGLETTSKDVVVNAYAIQTDNINDEKTSLDGNNGDGKVKPADVWEVLFNQRLVAYTPLEYIESTGTQYIDTGIQPNQDTRVVCDFQFTGVESDSSYHLGVFGARKDQNSSGAIAFALGYRYNTETGTKILRSDYSAGYIERETGLVLSPENLVNTRFTVDKDKNVTCINGTTYSDAPGDFSVPHEMYLFTFNSEGSTGTLSKLRMYSCKIYDDGKLVRDYRPGISSDGEVGMYDAVTKVFYRNNGTGSFIPGYYVADEMVLLADAEVGLEGSTLKNLAGDSSYNLTINGSLPYADKGLTFNGVRDNYISVPALTSLANTGGFTCEMAVNLTDIQTTQRILYLNPFFEFFVREGKINTDLHFDGDPFEQLKDTANTGFITFAAVFKANAYQKFYINGVEVESTSAGDASSTPVAGTIGQGGGGHPMAAGSKFYNLRVYKRALTDEEIMQNYQADVARYK